MASSVILTDREADMHLPGCQRLPSRCVCPRVEWIWANTSREAVRCGKWLLFPPTNAVDHSWATVLALMADGRLGVGAKAAPVSKVQPEKGHLICVYTNDHDDVADVMRVLLDLRDSDIPCTKIGLLNYKTDDATHAGIYHDAGPARHPKELVCKYTSPALAGPGKRIVLRLNNVGPDFGRRMVAYRSPNQPTIIKYARASMAERIEDPGALAEEEEIEGRSRKSSAAKQKERRLPAWLQHPEQAEPQPQDPYADGRPSSIGDFGYRGDHAGDYRSQSGTALPNAGWGGRAPYYNEGGAASDNLFRGQNAGVWGHSGGTGTGKAEGLAFKGSVAANIMSRIQSHSQRRREVEQQQEVERRRMEQPSDFYNEEPQRSLGSLTGHAHSLNSSSGEHSDGQIGRPNRLDMHTQAECERLNPAGWQTSTLNTNTEDWDELDLSHSPMQPTLIPAAVASVRMSASASSARLESAQFLLKKAPPKSANAIIVLDDEEEEEEEVFSISHRSGSHTAISTTSQTSQGSVPQRESRALSSPKSKPRPKEHDLTPAAKRSNTSAGSIVLSLDDDEIVAPVEQKKNLKCDVDDLKARILAIAEQRERERERAQQEQAQLDIKPSQKGRQQANAFSNGVQYQRQDTNQPLSSSRSTAATAAAAAAQRRAALS